MSAKGQKRTSTVTLFVVQDAEKRVVALADRLVALTCAFQQAFRIYDLNVSARVLQEPSLLQRTRDDGDAGATRPKYFGQVLLSKGKRTGPGEVARSEQQAGKPLFKTVQRVAGR